MEMKVCLKTLIEEKDGVTFTYTHARARALPIPEKAYSRKEVLRKS